MLIPVQKALRAAADPAKAVFEARFFKTGPGQYGEGDQFIGVTVPAQRLIAKQYYAQLSPEEATELLHSPIHEERLTALIILVFKYKKGTPDEQRAIYELYMANTMYINNWDLVDTSAEFIVGPYLQSRDKSVLEKLAHSDLIWDRRIAMLSTLHYIRQDQFEWAFRIIAILKNDPHGLIQKAVGWMLREIGKRDRATLTAYLDEHHRELPRTSLRYAIEHYSPAERQRYPDPPTRNQPLQVAAAVTPVQGPPNKT